MSVIGSVAGVQASLAATAAQSLFKNKQQELVNTWLANTDTVGGTVAHIAAGLGVEATSILAAPLQGPRNKANNFISTGANKLLNMEPGAADFMNKMYSVFQQPNIEGITIFTESEQCTRQCDVSEQPLIIQQSIGSTTYATDNAVPHPREWSLKGYLATILPTDHFLVLKPSLMLQRNYLDMCQKSRRPVWFKTFDNEFCLVLISALNTSYDPKAMNTISINITLKEYVPITSVEGPVSAALSTFMGAISR